MSADYNAICAFLYREARLLDDREWDQWLELYDANVEYWMPSWDDDDRPTEDPQSQISLIYYPNRNGLEDRVFRIKTERSSASLPETRINHMITNVEVLAERSDGVDVRYNFHTLSHRYKVTDHYFGTISVTLGKSESGFLITRKKSSSRMITSARSLIFITSDRQGDQDEHLPHSPEL